MKKEILVPAWSFVTTGNIAMILDEVFYGVLCLAIAGVLVFIGTNEQYHFFGLSYNYHKKQGSRLDKK